MIFPIALIGTISIWIIGYLTLNTFLWKNNLNFYEKILLSPPLFFVMPLIAYIFNLFFNGKILSNKIYFFVFVILYFTVICFFSYSKIKNDLIYLKGELRKVPIRINKKKIAFISSLIIIISLNIYISIRPLLIAPMLSYGQDYFRHIMYSRQLLNGFLFTHWCYDISPNIQPFLMHSAIAVLTRIFNFHIFDTIFVLIFFQAILLPIGVSILGYKIKNKFWVSLLFTFFICLNGGKGFVWRESWVSSIVQQQALPGLIMRQMSITLFFFFIYSIIKIFEVRDSLFFPIYSSIIFSILGTIHAHVFYFSAGLLIIMIILNFKDKKLIKILIRIFVTGISVSLIYYLPLLYDLLNKDLLMLQKSDERWTILLNFKRFLNFFGIIGVISIPSILLLPKIKYKKIFISIFIAVLIIYSITLIADLITGDEDPIMPFRQHKYFFIIYIFLSIMVILLINFLNKIEKKYILILCLFLIFLNVAFTTETILVNSDIWVDLSTRSGVKFNLLFRDKENVADKLLEIASKEDIISVPKEISKIFVHYSGLDVVYAPWKTELLKENIPELQRERNKDIETIYSIGSNEVLIKELFDKYKVKYFLVFKEDRIKFDSMNFLEVIDEGKWLDNRKILIYKVSI